MSGRLRSSVALIFSILGAGFALAGCGPRVSEARVAFYPPREKGCHLELVKADLGQMMVGGPWELIGHVYVSANATAEPFSEEYLSVVRPRACAMGGEAFGILMATTNDTRLVAGSTTDYVVVRKRQAPAETPPTAAAGSNI